MFPSVTAVLGIQVGLMAHTRQCLMARSIAESVILTAGTCQASAVSGVTILESGTVEISSCMSYKSLLVAIFVIVVTAAQVSCFVCFFECCQSTISHQAIIIIKTFSRGGPVPSLLLELKVARNPCR